MNYKNIYLNLCNRGKTTRKLNYSESHHILPRCMGGDDSEDNLTVLTAKEHYLAHLLLTKIYDNPSLMYAFGMMQTTTKKQKRRYTSSQYQKMKQSFSEAMKTKNPMFNEETRKKVSETRREKFRNGSLSPTVFSESVRSAISKRMTERNPMTLNPSKNRTAQPIRIHFEDGHTEDYSYAKEYCLKSGVPYSTIKLLMRAENSKCAKHGIKRIERL
jgi:5-methylcytosine-specific restriction endonuclease McrA